MVAYKYVVCSDINPVIYDEFDIADEAIAYAKENTGAEAYVKKVEVEVNDFGEVTQEYDSEIIWSSNDETLAQAGPALSPEEEEEWLKQMEQEEEDRLFYDPFEADEFDGHEDLDADSFVEALEENESEVECKHCYELFPKDECIKTEHGYLCKECASMREAENAEIDSLHELFGIEKDPEVEEQKRQLKLAKLGTKISKQGVKTAKNNMTAAKFDNQIDVNNAKTNAKVSSLDVEVAKNKRKVSKEKLKNLKIVAKMAKLGDKIKINHLDSEDAAYDGVEGEVEFIDNDGYLYGSWGDVAIIPGLDNIEVVEQAAVQESLENTVEIDLNDDRTPQPEESTEMEEPFVANEMRMHEKAIKEGYDDFNGVVDDWYLNDWDEPKVTVAAKPAEVTERSSEEQAVSDFMGGLNNQAISTNTNTPKPPVHDEPVFDSPEAEKRVADFFANMDENLEEHVQDRPTPVETEQELTGMDNAIVDCQTDYKVIAHSEDEKPLDCKMEKPALEEPIAGEEVDGKFYENLEEAKKDDELPVDPEAAKLEVHTMLNDLVADEIEAINGYEEAKAEILDTPIAHKDNILDTIDHVEDEEKEHVDELIDATTEIPFDNEHKEEAPVEEEHVEEPVNEDPFEQEFPEVAEPVETEEDSEAKEVDESYPDIPFDSEVKEGDKIRIIHLSGENDEYDGREGTVEHIDGIGQLHGTWGGLAVIPGVDEFEIITNESLTESANIKYAIGYCFWDYGWYEELIEKNSNGKNCCTMHRDNHFCNNEVYDGPTFDSVDACIAEVNNNIDKYAPYTYPENIDYASGRKNGSIYAIGLNEKQDGFVSRTIIFDCKAHKLVKHK